MKEPGPDHPITIVPAQKRVRVTFAGCVIADSARALLFSEAGYAPVYYIPRADARMAALIASEHRTYCPYKGEAGYFSIAAGGKRSENAVWTYERPYPAMTAIKEHLAFYPSRVEKIEEL
jgi:uncharacterized protein (DUF427 family)